MQMIKTTYFDLLREADLIIEDSCHSMIMYSYEAKTFYRQKACGCRTRFPSSTIFHPTNGNCVILGQDEPSTFDHQMIAVNKAYTAMRITTLDQLESAITDFNSFHSSNEATS
jgi:hypothetical protein